MGARLEMARSLTAPLRPYVQGQQVVLVGAAALPAPLVRDPERVYVAVNGGISSVPPGPVIWQVNARPGRGPGGYEQHHTVMVRQGASREVAFLILHLIGGEAGEGQCLQRLSAQGTVSLGGHVTIHRDAWDAIEQATGARSAEVNLTASSSGIRCLSVVLLAGAARVELVGFSWDKSYNYASPAFARKTRGHVRIDQVVLSNLCRVHGARIQHSLDLPARLTQEDVRMARQAGENPFLTAKGKKLDQQWVRATALGYYKGVRYRPGQTLTLRKPEHFKPSWMEAITAPEEMREVSAAEASRQQERAMPLSLAGRQPKLAPNAADVLPDDETIPTGDRQVLAR